MYENDLWEFWNKKDSNYLLKKTFGYIILRMIDAVGFYNEQRPIKLEVGVRRKEDFPGRF